MSTQSVLDEVLLERQRQNEKWGEQNHPCLNQRLLEAEADGPGLMAQYYRIPSERDAKAVCDRRFKNDAGTFADILIEEVAETIGTFNIEKRRQEVIQIAAVAVAWVEKIDRDLLKTKTV